SRRPLGPARRRSQRPPARPCPRPRSWILSRIRLPLRWPGPAVSRAWCPAPEPAPAREGRRPDRPARGRRRGRRATRRPGAGPGGTRKARQGSSGRGASRDQTPTWGFALQRTRSSHIGDRALVHLVEQRGVALFDHLALDLEARGQLALVDRQIPGQDRELPDGLVLGQGLVDLIEVRREQLLDLIGLHHLAVRLAAQALVSGPLHRGLLVERDQRGDEVALVTVDDDLADIRAHRLEL